MRNPINFLGVYELNVNQSRMLYSLRLDPGYSKKLREGDAKTRRSKVK